MGYFPNGATADRYREQWCETCLHWPGNDSPDECPVWMLQYDHGSCCVPWLNLLIPWNRKVLVNEQCTMFVQRGPARPETTENTRSDSCTA